ncbi:MAG: metal ABC transporter substrate-binding protein [Mobiluncus porci]|uniref:Metal ABC transporter substrate-binding protein n=1 Tax=Mobiluncus porci TaxID=2652278 RepID=A0A7K0K2Z8_9ACTO|nr:MULTISPECIES: metal ABC transporter substrate-binding protein [Mobiluncus]MCI6584656.1 metal ABC transporter substrate-binding protein [Mobiluncus sp.]MDD7542038.1 metal ABC transporter substrate-binding protein [Mobiluncus porci]MDY5747660.1 metal ABC transporter substrate-binding protein [Mobiluncus porci]MST49853.1 metal ABC transporter substrate-binding protein [Mobiluncus porci]
MIKKTRKKALSVLAVSLAVLALAACTGANGGNENKSTSAASKGEKPVVLTTFTVLQDMAQEVAGDHLEVRSITKIGAEIHDYQPTPSDIKSAQGAKLILNNGLGLERWFEKFSAELDAKPITVSAGVEPIDIQEGDYRGKPNPHAWMSPKNGSIYVKNMAKAFCELDAENCQDYKANADSYAQKITEIGDKISEELRTLPEAKRTLVTCEGAFSYLTRDYGLNELYLWAVNAEGALTPSRMAKVEQYVSENQVPAVFCESTVGDKMQPVVESTGVKYGGELFVDSLSEPDGPVPSYLELLQYDANLITTGLTGEAAK